MNLAHANLQNLPGRSRASPATCSGWAQMRTVARARLPHLVAALRRTRPRDWLADGLRGSEASLFAGFRRDRPPVPQRRSGSRESDQRAACGVDLAPTASI